MKQSSIWHLIIASVALLLTACPVGDQGTTEPEGPPPDPEGDDSINGARGLFDDVIIDSLNTETGDSVDYRWVELSEDGALEVRVAMQSPTVAGLIELRNAYGDTLTQRRVAMGETDLFLNHDASAGRYYIVVTAEEGAADYTIGRSFIPAGPDRDELQQDVLANAIQMAQDGDFDGAIAYLERSFADPDIGSFDRGIALLDAMRLAESNQFDEAIELLQSAMTDLPGGFSDAAGVVMAVRDKEEEYTASRRSRDRGRDRDRDRETETETATETETETVTETEVVEERSAIRATIVAVRSSGSVSILVLTGCSGVSEGDRGEVSGRGVNVVVTTVSGSNCEVEADAPSSMIGSARTVVF